MDWLSDQRQQKFASLCATFDKPFGWIICCSIRCSFDMNKSEQYVQCKVCQRERQLLRWCVLISNYSLYSPVPLQITVPVIGDFCKLHTGEISIDFLTIKITVLCNQRYWNWKQNVRFKTVNTVSFREKRYLLSDTKFNIKRNQLRWLLSQQPSRDLLLLLEELSDWEGWKTKKQPTKWEERVALVGQTSHFILHQTWN